MFLLHRKGYLACSSTYLFVEVRVFNSIFTRLHRIVSWACVAILLPFLLLFAALLFVSEKQKQKSMSYDNNLVSTNILSLFPFFQGKMLQINNYCSLCRRHSCTSYLATQKLGREEKN